MRQSLRNRSSRYKKRRELEFQRWQKQLNRIKARLEMGSYSKHLEKEECEKIRRLLSLAILNQITILSMRVGITKSRTFTVETSRTAYFRICKMLRIAGNRKIKSANTKIVRRQHDTTEV